MAGKKIEVSIICLFTENAYYFMFNNPRVNDLVVQVCDQWRKI